MTIENIVSATLNESELMGRGRPSKNKKIGLSVHLKDV